MKNVFKILLVLIIFFSFNLGVNAATYYITGDGVRVRSSAENTEDNVIGKLNYGDKIEVIELVNSWYKIQYGDGFGYVTYRYVSSYEDFNGTNKIATLKSKTALKKTKSSSSKTLIKIPKDGVVKVLEENGKYTKVQYNEIVGYVKTKYLKSYTNTKEIAVGTYTISFNLNNKYRNKNITKSMKKLNNVVIKNGETFSFINTVGKSGYKKAPEFDPSVKTPGGGLSEVSTALYLTVRDAQRNDCYISVVEQNRNDFITPYSRLGEEAMVDIKNNKDLKFINKSGKTLKIYSKVSGTSVSFTISEY